MRGASVCTEHKPVPEGIATKQVRGPITGLARLSSLARVYTKVERLCN